MSYVIHIYINSSSPDYFDKTLAGDTTITAELKAPIDIEKPTIYLSATDAYDGYNYCYIAEFGRYYFMTPVAGVGQTMTFECQSDPLMSFKSQIRQCPAVIARNPWHWDMYLPDPKMPVEARTVSAILNFPNANENAGPFDGTHNCYILTTLGG